MRIDIEYVWYDFYFFKLAVGNHIQLEAQFPSFFIE